MSKLERFVASFRNEAELRRAVIVLLERMRESTGLRLTHCPLECGKDIVFRWLGPFGRPQLVACVVKNEKISGSVDSDSGARSVFHQAEQALDTRIPNPADGSEDRVEQVVIISPYECTVQMVESIKGKLQARAGQVTFLCGRDLLAKFESYYAEYLWFQSGLYGSYVAALEKGLDSDSAVMNALFGHGFQSGAKTLSAVYVRPKFFLELRRFELRVAALDPGDTQEKMTAQEVEALCNSLRVLGRTVAAIEMPRAQGESLKASLLELADDVKESWRKTKIAYSAGKKVVGDLCLQLKDADRLHGRASEVIAEANNILQNFKRSLELADQFVSTRFRSANEAIESPTACEYCFAEGVSRRAPTSIVAQESTAAVLEFEESLLDSTQLDLFITGPAGFGKTSLCKWQTLADLRNLKENKSDVIPVYVPLHRLSQGTLESFESVFLGTPELVALWKARREGQRIVRRFRLYLDGLDEIPSSDQQQKLLELVDVGKKTEPSLSIIITGREHVVGRHLRPFVRIRVRNFDDAQIRQLATKWFDDDEGSVVEFFDQLKKVPALHPLMRVPLLATLVLGVYKSTKTLPESVVKLYEMFVHLLAGGWDVAKNLQRQTEFGPSPKVPSVPTSLRHR